MRKNEKRNGKALLPIVLFVVLYLGLGILFEYGLDIEMGFYKIPVVVIFLVALLVACIQNRELKLNDKLEVMGRGISDPNIITMIIIFMLSGIFVGIVGRTSANSVAYFILSLVPPQFAVVVLFVVSCFVSLPVCCGSAYRNKGVQKLLDAILEYMPAPTDIPPIDGVDMDGNPTVRHSSDEEPFSALAFKIMTDPFVGKLAYFRVYSGTMNSGSYVYNSTKGKKERVGRILQMHANKRMELDKVYSGDIAAAIGFKFTTTGDTICDEQHPVILESMEFPEPVIELAIEPKTKAGQGKLGEALAKLAEEDPTFRAHTDQETGQTIIAGMGELHLDIIVDRLLREFKVEANVGAPQVAYKETITKPVDVDSKYAKQSGGRGQYGHCKVKFEPMDANGEELYKFESTVVGGAIPKEYIPAVGEGIEEAMKAGILGGFPVVGVHANVYDGSYHEVDSSEMAFHIAGSLAFKDAMQKAAPILLEPIMRVEVTTPEDYMGDVIGDINSRRGRIEGMDDIGGGKMIRGFVPLSEMFGYATDLRSRTQGRGNYSMFFEKYEQVPKSVQEKILSKKD